MNILEPFSISDLVAGVKKFSGETLTGEPIEIECGFPNWRDGFAAREEWARSEPAEMPLLLARRIHKRNSLDLPFDRLFDVLTPEAIVRLQELALAMHFGIAALKKMKIAAEAETMKRLSSSNSSEPSAAAEPPASPKPDVGELID